MTFDARSERNLVGVAPPLVQVVRLAALTTPTRFAVIEGVRTWDRQRGLYAQGRTAPGRIVTNTMNSKHLVHVDGYGHAVDLLPFNPATGKFDWNYREGFDAVHSAMMLAATQLGVPVRSGMDWDRDGTTRERGETDSPHFELVPA